MKSICFIGNFNLLNFYFDLRSSLIERKIDSYYILFSDMQFERLVKEVPEDHILLLNRSYIDKGEDPIDDFKVNEILYCDRVFKYELESGKNFLYHIQKPIYNFIKTNKIDVVIGENTLSEEVLIYRMCKKRSELNCRYFSTMTTRIPSNRFFFFTDERQSIIYKTKSQKANTDFDNLELRKPEYKGENDKIVKKSMSAVGLINRAKRFFTGENIEKTNPNLSVKKRIIFKKGITEVINQQTYKSFKKSQFLEYSEKKYIFYGLHKQPESSIDTCGRYDEDQYQNILNIWRNLPPDWYLIVKEHSNAIGDRGSEFYKKLSKYPNIIIINEMLDSYEVIKHAQLIITVTGTMALEAAFMGVPSITLAPVQFNCLNYCRHMTWKEIEKYGSIADLILDITSLDNNIDDYVTEVKKYSYDGYMNGNLDIIRKPENITKACDALNDLFSVSTVMK